MIARTVTGPQKNRTAWSILTLGFVFLMRTTIVMMIKYLTMV